MYKYRCTGGNDYPINGRLLLYIFLYSVFTVEIKMMFHLKVCMFAVFTKVFIFILILLNSASVFVIDQHIDTVNHTVL